MDAELREEFILEGGRTSLISGLTLVGGLVAISASLIQTRQWRCCHEVLHAGDSAGGQPGCYPTAT